MIALFVIAAAAAAPAPAPPAPSAQSAPATAQPSTARAVVAAQLNTPPRPDNRRSLGAEEADTIYKRYIASIGQRLDRATESAGPEAR